MAVSTKSRVLVIDEDALKLLKWFPYILLALMLGSCVAIRQMTPATRHHLFPILYKIQFASAAVKRKVVNDAEVRELFPELKQDSRDPKAPPGAWNDFPGKLRTPIEQEFQESGAWLVIRSGPGLPGWWYGIGRPNGPCIRGSLYTNRGDEGPSLWVCEPKGWVSH